MTQNPQRAVLKMDAIGHREAAKELAAVERHGGFVPMESLWHVEAMRSRQEAWVRQYVHIRPGDWVCCWRDLDTRTMVFSSKEEC